MKSLTVVALCVTFAAVVWARSGDDEKYDEALAAGVDVEDVLRNDRLRRNYFICFKTGDKCTTQAKKVKDLIPEALTTGCKKCTASQKEIIKKVLRFIIKNHPEEFLELEKIYDKERIFRAKFSDELTKDGITLPN